MSRIFISYAHRDANALTLFQEALQQSVQVPTAIFSDVELRAGDRFHDRLKFECLAADVTIFLVSSAFLASRFCTTVELMWGVERANRQVTPLVPVILEPCAWKDTILKHFQAAPDLGKPISEFEPPAAGFLSAVESVKAALHPAQSYLWYGPSSGVAAEYARQSVDGEGRLDLGGFGFVTSDPESIVGAIFAHDSDSADPSHDHAAGHESGGPSHTDISGDFSADDFDDFGDDHF
jgi:hypothetical protein